MSDWLKYQWEWDQHPILIRVDMQYWQLLPTLAYPHLIYIACAPRNPNASSFTLVEEKRLSSLYHSLVDHLQEKAIYVGMVEATALRQYYFYSSDPKLLNEASTICRAEPHLRTTYGQTEEPTFATYYKFLFPDDVKLQSVENEAFIDSVAKKGGDLNLVRRIGMKMAFPSFEARETYLAGLSDIGLMMGVSETEEHPTHPYVVTVYGYSTLRLSDLNRCTARAIRSAAEQDGMLIDLSAEFIEKH